MPASVANVNTPALGEATKSPDPSQAAQSGALADNLSVGQTKVQDLVLYNQAGVTQSKVPAASSFLSGSGPVVLDILNSDSGYEQEKYWSSDNFATRHYPGVDNKTGSFNTGQASANFNNFEHAKDLASGGDKDFNAAIIRIRTTPTPADPPAAAASAAPSNPTPASGTVLDSVSQLKDNRSGLADGTNQGQGAGTVNSPNQGTNNPGTANKAGETQTQAQTQAQVQSRPQTAAEKRVAEAKAQADAQAIATAKRTAEAKAKAEAQVQAQAAAAAKKIAAAKAKAEAQAQAQIAAAKIAAEAKAKADAQIQTQAQAILAAAKKAHDKRSEPGDGTNPGQGAGTANSPNQGTNNSGTTGASGRK